MKYNILVGRIPHLPLSHVLEQSIPRSRWKPICGVGRWAGWWAEERAGTALTQTARWETCCADLRWGALCLLPDPSRVLP